MLIYNNTTIKGALHLTGPVAATIQTETQLCFSASEAERNPWGGVSKGAEWGTCYSNFEAILNQSLSNCHDLGKQTCKGKTYGKSSHFWKKTIQQCSKSFRKRNKMFHLEDIGNIPLFITLFKENIEYITSVIKNIQKTKQNIPFRRYRKHTFVGHIL